MEVLTTNTCEAWGRLYDLLLESGVDSVVSGVPVMELNWISIHVENPLLESRISIRFYKLCEEIQLGVGSMPNVYMKQITNQVTEGYWWEVYRRPIWEQIPRLVTFLKENSSYNKPSITIRDSVVHLGGSNTPCLMHLTFQIRDSRLEMGAHFDTNAIEYLQTNMYGLTELQRN